MLRRTRSEVSLSSIFNSGLHSGITEFETSLAEIQLQLNSTDKRHLVSLIGASALGVLGIVLSGGTLTVVVGGGLAGLVVGHMCGRKWKRHHALAVPADKAYLVRLICLNVYLRTFKKKRVTPNEVLAIVEAILSEFRAALVLQLDDPGIATEVNKLRKVLRKGQFQCLLLRGLCEIQQLIEQRSFLNLAVHRLRRSYIPAKALLDGPERFEFTIRMENLLADDYVARLLFKLPISDSHILAMLFPYPSLALADAEHCWRSTQALVDAEMMLNAKHFQENFRESFANKRMATALLRRRQSCAGEASDAMFKLQHSEEHRLDLLSLLTKAPADSPPNPIELQRFEPIHPVVHLRTDELLDDSSSSDEDPPEEPPPLVHYSAGYQDLLRIEAESTEGSGWLLTVDKPETKVYQRKEGESPICIIKAFCQVQYPAEAVFRAIWWPDFRVKWDKLFEEFRVVPIQDYEILYYMIKTPIGITRRDWVQKRMYKIEADGTYFLHFISVEEPEFPPKHNVIRAETLISGYIIRPTSPDTCTVTIISQNDIKGLVPKVIVNKIAARAPADWVRNMNRGCKIVMDAGLH